MPVVNIAICYRFGIVSLLPVPCLGQASILYWEDMQNGLIIENALQIVNPFFEVKTWI